MNQQTIQSIAKKVVIIAALQGALLLIGGGLTNRLCGWPVFGFALVVVLFPVWFSRVLDPEYKQKVDQQIEQALLMKSNTLFVSILWLLVFAAFVILVDVIVIRALEFGIF